MSARGAKVTDIVVLVVAADDGVMPQTVEAIDHAKAAAVPIVVAVNKIDKPEAQPDRGKQQLSDRGLMPEEWGGSTVFVNVSAKKRQNLEQLLEMLLLVADLQELKANPRKAAAGTVLEARLDKGRGPVATVLVQDGTLHVSDTVVAGAVAGKTRSLADQHGPRLKEPGPAPPIAVLGPAAGCYVTDGRVNRGAQVRLLRDNVVIHTGKVSSLKRFKDDVTEVKAGLECGIGIANYNDIKPADVIEFFTTEKVKETLE